MSDGTDRKPAAPLERPVRLRPSWLRRLARLMVGIALCVAIVGQCSDIARVDRRRDCAAASRKGRWATAVQLCRPEFEGTQDPTIGVHLADALDRTGDRDAAKRVAGALLATSAQSDALQILGRIARTEGRNEEAVTALERARELHRTEQKPKQLARDSGLLALARMGLNEFAEALRLADECITEAQRAGDTGQQNYCHLVAAKTLIRVGHASAAEQEFEVAKSLANSDDERSDLEYQRGSHAQEQRQYATAIARFTNALRYRKLGPNVVWTINTELNLAYSLAENGQIDEAQRHFENAIVLDSNHEKEAERMWVAAQIAFQRHDLMRASSLTETYFKLLGSDDSVDRDDQIDVATLQATIELERGDLGRAEHWARHGVKQAELVRGAQSALELRPWVLAKRRAPYELLFTALARSGKVEAAAMVFDQWQGRTVQDALATPRPQASLDRRGIADQVIKIGKWLRVASPAAFARSPDEQSVLSTMRDIDLLALIVANGDVWRLTANHGSSQLSKLRPLAEIEEFIAQFQGHATDVELASRLGALLLPDDAFRATHDVLHVLVDGRLGGLPVAALRRGNTPLIAMRPIVRVLRLPETRCASATRSGRATVLAAPGSDLSNTITEAEQVAAILGTTAKTGAAATKGALFASAKDAVLHIAAHSAIGNNGASGHKDASGNDDATIVLANGEVSALEISAGRVAPSLVVLSACHTAASDDFELAGSLVAGFLGGGSQRVVATLRSVSDAGAQDVSIGFYRAGGVANPARALAFVQSALAKTDNLDWPYFTVFGPDVCREGTADSR